MTAFDTPRQTNAFQSALLPLAELERAHAKWALTHLEGNKRATARALGIGRHTLARKLGETD